MLASPWQTSQLAAKEEEGKAYHIQPTEGNSGPTSIPLSNEQLEQICKFLSQSSVISHQQSKPSNGSCSIAQSGKKNISTQIFIFEPLDH